MSEVNMLRAVRNIIADAFRKLTLGKLLNFVWQKLNFRLLSVRIKNKFLPHGKHMSATQSNRACRGVFIGL